MNVRTNTFLTWAVAICIPIAVALISYFTKSSVMDSVLRYLNPSPYMELSILTTLESIARFSGETTEASEYRAVDLRMTISLLLVLVLGPYLFVKGYKKSEDMEGLKHWMWYPGAVAAIFISVLIIPASIQGFKVWNNTIKSAAESRQIDLMRQELAEKILKAGEITALPAEMGGGSGSFDGFVTEDGGQRLIALSDLNDLNEDYEYRLETARNDSTLIIYVSKMSGDEGYELSAELHSLRPFDYKMNRQKKIGD
jgi:hypothetical protein